MPPATLSDDESGSSAASEVPLSVCRDRLRKVAESDEMTDDLPWPMLQDAIKRLLDHTFSQWPTDSRPILHPAAALLPPLPSLIDEEASGSTLSVNGASDSQEKENIPSNGAMQTLAASSASPNTATAALALSSRFSREGDETVPGADDLIPEADLQAFFPSKKRAPAEWGGSWGRRLDTQKAIESEKEEIFADLDEFFFQAPFTIQRLAELVLEPTRHYHTLPKYISAIKTLLNVMASRDSFPTNTVEDEGGNLLAGSTTTTAEMINGHASPSTIQARSRTVTPVPGSPSTAPLFSPIPFLIRPSGEDSMSGEMSQEDIMMANEDVPGMELGGADRTTEEAIEHARQTGAGAGSGLASVRSLADQPAEASSGLGDEEGEQPEPIVHPAPEARRVSGTLSSMKRNDDDVSDLRQNGNGSSSTSNQPLGVPSGRVDELDQLGENQGKLLPVDSTSVGGGARALTSTTTSTTTESDAAPPGEGSETADDSAADSQRAVKRVRSERSLLGAAEDGA